MNIILTYTFIVHFKKKFRKNHFLIKDLIASLSKQKFLKLNYPFFKVKLFLNNTSIRWIVLLKDKDKIIPMFFVLKKEKDIWNNIILDKKIKNKLNILMEKYENDFKNWNYVKY